MTRIGAGTGIFTQALLTHPGWSSDIGQLKAVEPSEGMRSAFSKNVTDKRATTQEGTFDHTGIDDGWADIIVVAQVSMTFSAQASHINWAGVPLVPRLRSCVGRVCSHTQTIGKFDIVMEPGGSVVYQC